MSIIIWYLSLIFFSMLMTFAVLLCYFKGSSKRKPISWDIRPNQIKLLLKFHLNCKWKQFFLMFMVFAVLLRFPVSSKWKKGLKNSGLNGTHTLTSGMPLWCATRWVVSLVNREQVIMWVNDEHIDCGYAIILRKFQWNYG